MPSGLFRRGFYTAMIAIAHLGNQAAVAPALAASPEVLTKKSGYALDGTSCGMAPMAFLKLPIGMRPGYCAGLVASKDDGLLFPRSVVQVPDRNFLSSRTWAVLIVQMPDACFCSIQRRLQANV